MATNSAAKKQEPGAVSKKPGLRYLESGKVQARYRCDGCNRHKGLPSFHTGTFTTVRDAQDWRTKELAAVKGRTHVDLGDATTVYDFATRWVDSRTFRGSTAKRYAGMLTHLNDTPLGNKPVVKVKPMDVQDWVSSRAVLLSASTLDRLFTFVRGVFKSALNNGLIVRNPCVDISLPDIHKPDYVPLTVQQVQSLADAMPDRYRAAVIVQASLGLRVGELLGLKVSDIDRDAGIVTVQRQMSQKGRDLVPLKTAPKTPKREVPLPKHVSVALAAHILAFPVPATDDYSGGLLFTTERGHGVRYDVYAEKVFKPAVKRAKLPTGTTTHDLRHHAASELLADGVPVATLAKMLGHSVAVLLATYAHARKSDTDRARDAMDRVWGQDRVMPVSQTALRSV
jgi:integrase